MGAAAVALLTRVFGKIGRARTRSYPRARAAGESCYALVMLRIAVATLVMLVPGTAHATWSVVAVDPVTQEVGVAVASCVEAPFGTTILPEVAGVVPGVGALAAQALFSQQTRDQAVALLAAGNTPQDVIDMVNASDGGSASRQYGVVTLDGQAAGYTGSATQDWAGDLQGEGVSVQGNILYGPEVVGDALTAFEAEAPTCPYALADRLMVALEAGAAQGGDNRCSEAQSALAAVLIVTAPDDAMDAPYLDLRVPSQPEGGDNPVELLRGLYDEWRLDHPLDDSGCNTGTGTGGGSTSGGAGSTSGAGSGNTSGSPATSTSGGDGGTIPPGAEDGGESGGGASTGGSSGSSADETTDRDDGCTCAADGPSPATSLGWIVLAAVAMRRRVRRLRRGRRPVTDRTTPENARTGRRLLENLDAQAAPSSSPQRSNPLVGDGLLFGLRSVPPVKTHTAVRRGSRKPPA